MKPIYRALGVAKSGTRNREHRLLDGQHTLTRERFRVHFDGERRFHCRKADGTHGIGVPSV